LVDPGELEFHDTKIVFLPADSLDISRVMLFASVMLLLSATLVQVAPASALNELRRLLAVKSSF
jgi:hypothetical protein